MAAFRGVYLWEVKQENTGKTMKAALQSLPVLEACAHKTGCSMEVLGMGGLPLFLRRLQKKQVWSAGLLLFAAGLYLLSSFIWTVEVEGNERLTQEELLSACESMGVRPGAWKGSVDTGAVTKELLRQFSDISWVSTGIDGTKVTIRLAETIEQAERIDRETPCDIIAAEDGIVVQITAERGTPQVQSGDVVCKGDVLISSALLIGLEGEEQHTDYTAAEGAVTARFWQRLTEEIPLQYEERIYSGAEEDNHSIIFMEKELDIIHPDDAGNWEKKAVSDEPLHLGDFRLPVSLKKENWKAYEMQEKTRTSEEAKALLEEMIRKKAEHLLSPYGKIEQIEINYTEYTDSVRGEAEVTVLDRIDEKRKIQERERENLNEF